MRIAISFLALIMTLMNVPAFAKIRFLTFHCNKPDFIELQCKAFKKFMDDEDDYELIVFNDANTSEKEKAVREMCEKYGIQCVRFEQHWHYPHPLNDYISECLNDPAVYSHLTFEGKDPFSVQKNISLRHCHVIQYAMDNFAYNHDDIVAIVDGDLFPIRYFDLRFLMKDCDIAAIGKYIAEDGVGYLWVPFIAFDMRTLPNKRDLKFHVDRINDIIYDSGAHTYHYLANNPTVRVKKFDWHSSSVECYNLEQMMRSKGYNKREIELVRSLPCTQSVEFHFDHHLLHFGGSSFELDGHLVKAECVKKFMEKIVE